MKWCSAGMWHFPCFLDDHFVPPPTVQMVSGFCYSTRVFFFFTSTRIFFCLDSNFKISNCVCSNDICLVFFRSWTYILQISTHVFYCIRCILQVSTYVLCFQHVFTIGIILSTTERHSYRFQLGRQLSWTILLFAFVLNGITYNSFVDIHIWV